ncbi:hypothetical protein ACIQV2_32980 [Streptomyces globosus]|uniref:hypothetical protein n=1 Tax=Streptomyces globosus TaxID=68209 RepID=UPI00380B51E9
MPDKENVCKLIKGEARKYCERGGGLPDDPPRFDVNGVSLMDGAVHEIQELYGSLMRAIEGLIAPDDAWAPETPDNWLYGQFLWLGQHLAVSIFICVVVVCGLTAWQGTPRMRQLGASTGWTLAAIAGMAAVPGAVMLLNQAVSAAIKTMLSQDEGTLFQVIEEDLKTGADSGNPLAVLIIGAALVVATGFACLVYMSRQLGIVLFVCMAPLVLASLARGGEMSAVKAWAGRLLGLMVAPFALILVTPFVALVKGSLVMDAVLLILADVIMLRVIFHGVPYFGPRIAGAARGLVERRTSNPLARAAVRAGAPAYYEEENAPRSLRTVPTPGRAMGQDGGALLGAYGLHKPPRPGRLTTASAVARAGREEADRAGRTALISQARRQARAAAMPASPQGRPSAAGPAARPGGGQTPPPPPTGTP